MSLLLGSLAMIGIVALIVLLGAGGIAMIARSRGKHGTSGSLNSAWLEIQSLLEPEKKRVVETMRAAAEAEDADEIDGKK
ncbi:MAG TPA: hypothetical protein VHX14_22200 [Thermoanaerobaculia bacterium]|jgi:hypothetical protein|nr:hypothetical protein [Thermoanaerobaculia bacterium]